MNAPRITSQSHTTSNGSTRAGERPLEREMTQLLVDGEHVDTIIWNSALLRRLDRRGITREQFVAERIAALG